MYTPPSFPYPMQYMGSKQRISQWIIDGIERNFENSTILADIMAGSSAVSHAAAMSGFQLITNDIQPYAATVASAAFQVPRDGLEGVIRLLESQGFEESLLADSRKFYSSILDQEKYHFVLLQSNPESWEKYADFVSKNQGTGESFTKSFDLFTSYYRNTYFGIRQCLEIDTVREIADSQNLNIKVHLLAALISAMTNLATTTTHLAQYLKPKNAKTAINVAEKRKRSIRDWIISCLRKAINYPLPKNTLVMNQPFENALRSISNARAGQVVIYADPPYFKEHYSRYYHLLDTLVLYDFPELTFNKRINAPTVGLYRKDRIRSDFGLRSEVRNAFQRLITLSYETKSHLVLSYADTSLLDKDEIISIAESSGYEATLQTIDLKHSGQGQKNTKNSVKEFLFILRYQETRNEF